MVDRRLASVYDYKFAGVCHTMAREAPPVYICHPPTSLLIEVMWETYRDPITEVQIDRPIRVLSSPDKFNAINETFRIGHYATTLADRGIVGVRVADDDALPFGQPTALTDESGYMALAWDDQYGLSQLHGDEAISPAWREATSAWESAQPYTGFDRERWRDVTTLLIEETSEECYETFRDLMDLKYEAPPSRKLHVVSLLLLAGARTQTPQRDIANWCESVGLASSSTVSMRKSELLDQEIIGTNKIPNESPGRPPEALHIPKSYLRDTDLAEFYRRASDILSNPMELTAES